MLIVIRQIRYPHESWSIIFHTNVNTKKIVSIVHEWNLAPESCSFPCISFYVSKYYHWWCSDNMCPTQVRFLQPLASRWNRDCSILRYYHNPSNSLSVSYVGLGGWFLLIRGKTIPYQRSSFYCRRDIFMLPNILPDYMAAFLMYYMAYVWDARDITIQLIALVCSLLFSSAFTAHMSRKHTEISIWLDAY